MCTDDDRYLDLTIRIKDDHFELNMYEPESGETETITGEYSFDEHPEFDKTLGEMVMSWVSLWFETRSEEDELG